MTDTVTAFVDADDQADLSPEAATVEQKLIDQLVERARSKGLQLTGVGGLLQQLTKTVLESALEGEITDHLGHGKHDPAGKDGSNSRNGPVQDGADGHRAGRDRRAPRPGGLLRAGHRQEAAAPADRRGRDGALAAAKGLTHGEISAHLAEVYGADVSKTTISTITDKVMDGMAEWQNRPLDRGRFPLIVANQW